MKNRQGGRKDHLDLVGTQVTKTKKKQMRKRGREKGKGTEFSCNVRDVMSVRTHTDKGEEKYKGGGITTREKWKKTTLREQLIPACPANGDEQDRSDTAGEKTQVGTGG